ncbi:single-stranded-DNA-specific exonuclease RecJ [Helicobacter sp. 11S02596-1]|uniref:single-stranded-DNA-specific exonuclease RecJ n=1 Tax=Helicobacter sp. 11S02596-1 TaxID=1476194 RepID=UPI000BA5D0C2|nr:single-stranded-DNA-specific exonuclease RecJ [Helicobacter sp. 11S02596-1]PAF45211.1 single-stranded-DNA-specific exonuclease RecJ [Helicobacter sp. 11S02596-1]
MNFISKQEIENALSRRFRDDRFTSLQQLPHPYELKDAKKAAALITKAIKKNQKILVVGDYDVDGITSCVIMARFFRLIGYQNFAYIIPNRFNDGYGISKTIVEKNPAELVITVDNGISAFETGEYCKKHHIPFIITDHHTIKDKLPTADAIINPQQTDCPFPQKEVCGATLAWYLCNAIKLEMGLEISLSGLLDLVCIATIADMMPLLKINKILVKAGLKKFITSPLAPNQILKNFVKTKTLTAQDIAYSIAPLINSSGRMGDGNLAARFLLANDEKTAQSLFLELKALNEARKQTAQNILELAQNTPLVGKNCVIAYGKDWHEGVLGIVAANLANTHHKPAIVLSQKDNTLKGSARSYGDINLIGALQAHSGYFTQFGGHAKAVGLQIEHKNLESFFEAFRDFEMPRLKEKEPDEDLGILDPCDIDDELLSILERFEPYGQGNPQPSFLCENLTITSAKNLKSRHQQLEFHIASRKQKAMAFFCETFYQANDAVNIRFNLQRDGFSNAPLMILKTIIKCPL